MKLYPKNVKLCPGCPSKELDMDILPQFNFKFNHKTDTKKITIVNNVKNKIDNKLKSLF